MSYKLNVTKSFSIFFIVLAIVPFYLLIRWFIPAYVSDPKCFEPLLIIILPIILFISYISTAFIFFRSIRIEKNSILLHFGPCLIYKRYYYKDMKDIRYAKKDDLIVRGQPAYGYIKNTVVIIFQDEKVLFISVEKTSEFYEILLKKIK